MNFIESLESGARWLLGVLEPIANFGPSFNGESVPLFAILLIGTGIFLTFRLGLVQPRRRGQGFGDTCGKYDGPTEPLDVSHCRALTTALPAVVGIGNIAGLAMAIHYGGPCALFWLWLTALPGVASEYSEVTVAERYRRVEAPD